MFQKFRFHTNTIVFYDKVIHCRLAIYRFFKYCKFDAAAFLGIFYRVAQQIEQNLGQQIVISDYQRIIPLKFV